MFANSSVFDDVREVRSLVFGQNQMFGYVQSSVLMILKKIEPFFINKVLGDVREVRSSVLDPNEMF